MRLSRNEGTFTFDKSCMIDLSVSFSESPDILCSNPGLVSSGLHCPLRGALVLVSLSLHKYANASTVVGWNLSPLEGTDEKKKYVFII